MKKLLKPHSFFCFSSQRSKVPLALLFRNLRFFSNDPRERVKASESPDFYPKSTDTPSESSSDIVKVSRENTSLDPVSGELSDKRDPLEITKKDMIEALKFQEEEVPVITDESQLAPSDILIDDYSRTPDRFSPNRTPGMSINAEIDIITRGNALAESVLRSGQIDLAQKEVHAKSIDVMDSIILKESIKKMTQINLGEVKTIPTGGILLEDVDPKNIPEDLDIVISPIRKELTAIGVEVPVEEGETGELEEKEQREMIQEQTKQAVSGNIFHEKSNKEIKDEIFLPFEKILGWFKAKNTFKFLIFTIPAFFFIDALTDTILEVYYIKKNHFLIEQQELQALIKGKESLMMEFQAAQKFKR